VVVFPDSAVHGTDKTNMQIKEFHPKNGNGKWLAVHIPDHMPYPRKNVRIIASKKAEKDLEKVVGPNKASLAMEIQSILGVDEDTLHKMIVKGENNDDADDDDNDSDDDDDGGGDDNDDDDDDESDVIGDPLSDDETSDNCDDSKNIEDKGNKKVKFSTKNRHAKLCKTAAKNKTRKEADDGSGIGNDILEVESDDKPKVEQPQGFELRWEDILNNFKNFDAKRRKKICKLFALQSDTCHNVKKRRKHSFKKKLKHYLLRMLRKFLKKNKNDFEDYLGNK